ncbi:MAG: B12-binding domain-containing radical SAM protein [Rhodospirillales bacterium]|nr:B12-binding domain-containing radical SAM protein [Rhodospirillales bacterium]
MSIAFAYITAYLRKHRYDPVWVDGIANGLNRVWPLTKYPGYVCQGLNFDEILARVPADSEIVGFNAMFSGEWPVMRDLIAAARGRCPDAVFVAGGEHATALSEFVLDDCPALDIVVRGEGEHTFYEVLEAITAGIGLDRIDGIVFRGADGRAVRNSNLPRLRDLSAVPWPHWPDRYLEQFWAAGKSYGPQTDRDIPMMFSRGCPYRCTFCSSPQMWTTRYVLRDPADVIDEVAHYVDKYKITGVQLYDLTAITKKRWTVELLSGIVARGIKVRWAFPSGTRSEILDDECLRLLKEAGCNYLAYAPESGSPPMLEKLKKRIDLDRMTRSVRTAKRLGLVVRTNFIIGFPGETRLDVYRTLAYGLGLSAGGVDEVQPNIFSPYPGSELFERLYRQGRIVLDDRYFLALTSLNSDLTVLNPLTFNECMGPRELALYRFIFTALNYGIGYLFYPSRILRTFRNLAGGRQSATVFEHRIKDALMRRRGHEKVPASQGR